MTHLRLFAAGIALGAVAIATVSLLQHQAEPPLAPAVTRADSAAPRTDSVWYHTSDVALLAKTGRPQLVELFHPG